MKPSVQIDIDSVDSVDRWRPRSQSSRRRPVENLSFLLVDGRRSTYLGWRFHHALFVSAFLLFRACCFSLGLSSICKIYLRFNQHALCLWNKCIFFFEDEWIFFAKIQSCKNISYIQLVRFVVVMIRSKSFGHLYSVKFKFLKFRNNICMWNKMV